MADVHALDVGSVDIGSFIRALGAQRGAERTEVAQTHTLAARERTLQLIGQCIDEDLDVRLRERAPLVNLLHEFIGRDHLHRANLRIILHSAVFYILLRSDNILNHIVS